MATRRVMVSPILHTDPEAVSVQKAELPPFAVPIAALCLDLPHPDFLRMLPEDAKA